MSANKIIFNNEVLVDLTGDTAIESDVASGKTFHKADGTQVTGTGSLGGITPTGTVAIKSNGTWDVTEYASAEVAVPSEIPDGYYDTSDATATASTIRSGYTAYVKNGKVSGTMPTRTLPTPDISVSTNGTITASSTLSSGGYVTSATKSSNLTLSEEHCDTFTESNIKSGVTIFGKTGTYSGESSVPETHTFTFTDTTMTMDNSGWMKARWMSSDLTWDYTGNDSASYEDLYIDESNTDSLVVHNGVVILSMTDNYSNYSIYISSISGGEVISGNDTNEVSIRVTGDCVVSGRIQVRTVNVTITNGSGVPATTVYFSTWNEISGEYPNDICMGGSHPTEISLSIKVGTYVIITCDDGAGIPSGDYESSILYESSLGTTTYQMYAFLIGADTTAIKMSMKG